MILVTGGTGLVGAHLLYQLSLENNSVIAIHRKSSNLDAVKRVFSYYSDDYERLFNKITWKIADLNDLSALNDVFIDITHVYHCAALISFDKKDEKLLRKVNIKGTANMVNIALEHNIEKFCFVSSIAVFNKALNNAEITEDNDWNSAEKNNVYAISKYGAEIEVWRASQEGLNVVIVNPGVILGAGFWKTGTGKLFDVVYNGFKYYTTGVTGYVGVSDLVKSMILLMKSAKINERYILVTENISHKTVLYAIADGFKTKRPSIKVSKILGEIGWRLETIKSFITRKPPLISKDSTRSSNKKTYYSNEKIKRELDFEFEPIRDYIKRVCNKYKRDL